jgi:uncharacterized protein (TIGR03086 family)
VITVPEAEGSTGEALTGGVALLERALGYTLGSLVLVTPAGLAAPTPCRDWDLRALLGHMNDSMLALHEAMAAGFVQLDAALEPGGGFGDPDADPVATLRNRACHMMGAWAGLQDPGRVEIGDQGLSAAVVAAVGAVEVAVHGWDVAESCGTPRPLPDGLAEELIELCPLFVAPADRPGRFGPPLAVSPLAGPGDRLLAFLGRRATGDWRASAPRSAFSRTRPGTGADDPTCSSPFRTRPGTGADDPTCSSPFRTRPGTDADDRA